MYNNNYTEKTVSMSELVTMVYRSIDGCYLCFFFFSFFCSAPSGGVSNS